MLRRTNTDLGQLAWRVFNEGAALPPLVFLHGAGGRKEMWSLVARRLQALVADRPLVLVDLPGHGQSSPPGHARIEDYAKVVVAFADANGWERFALAGHSMGGAIAQAVAATDPERITHLVLVATGAQIPVAPVLFDLLPDQPDAVVMAFKQFGFGPNAPSILVDQAMTPFAQTDPHVILDDLTACREWDAGDRLAAIDAATLVLAGEVDQMIKTRFSRALADGLSQAQFEILPQVGHMAPVEADRDLAQRLAVFLTE